MAFLDEIGKKISQTSQGMVQKTKDTAESMKLNGAIAEEEKRIQALYLEIGKMYFELHADSYESALEAQVLGIKEANEKIEAYHEQIKRLKGIVRCAVCGGEVPYGAPFCSSCGSKMMNENTVAPTAESNVRHCANCGAVLADGIAFCTNCGTPAPAVEAPAPVVEAPAPVVEAPAPVVEAPAPVVEAPAPVVEAPAPVVEAPAPVVEAPAPVVEAPAPVVEAPAAHICTNCGNPVADGMAFCVNCGTKVTAPAPAPAPAVRTCPGCGNVVADGMAFCTNCGTKM